MCLRSRGRAEFRRRAAADVGKVSRRRQPDLVRASRKSDGSVAVLSCLDE